MFILQKEFINLNKIELKIKNFFKNRNMLIHIIFFIILQIR